MQIEERSAGDVTILDLKGKMTLGEGDEILKDKINSLVLQGRKKIVTGRCRCCESVFGVRQQATVTQTAARLRTCCRPKMIMTGMTKVEMSS